MSKLVHPDELEPRVPPHLGGGRIRCHRDEGALDFAICEYGVRTMLDVGCGLGCMVELARRKGIQAWGVDGDPFGNPEFIWDFSIGPCPDLPGSVDLVWSVEFVEQVEAAHISNFMEAFLHGRHLLMTHAPPGKKSHHHVNTQDSSYWVKIAERCGFEFDPDASDRLRAASTMQSIEWDGRIVPSKKKRFIRDYGLIFHRR